MKSNDEQAVSSARETLRKQLGTSWTKQISAAFDFAAQAHSAQYRSAVSGRPPVPYIVHPVSVAILCDEWYGEIGLDEESREELIIAALLHDSVEDCSVSVADVANRFGTNTSKYVSGLTRPPIRSDESAHDRMVRFVEQIQRVGLAAIFIKMCDFVHNISGSEQSPLDVIQRALKKGDQYYLPMLSQLNSSTFTSFVCDVVQQTRQKVQDREATSNKSPSDPIGKLADMLLAGDAKFDVHDAPRLFEAMFPGSAALVVSLPCNNSPIAIAGAPELMVEKHTWNQIAQTARSSHGFAWLKRKWFGGAVVHDARYCVWMEPAVFGGDVLILGKIPAKSLGNGAPPPSLVMRCIMSSVHRQNIVLWRDLSVEAMRLGMQVDINLAMELGVQRGQLELLRDWRDHCELACRTISAEVNRELLSRFDKPSLWHRIRTEYRVKSPDSILKKMCNDKRFSWPDFSSMRDIAGIRIICPTLVHVLELVEWFEGSSHPWRKTSPIQRFDLNPTSDGYRGVHISLALLGRGGRGYEVPCEIQIRTLVQDVWATLSHKVAYKPITRAERELAENLKQLGCKLAECETTITKIFETALKGE